MSSNQNEQEPMEQKNQQGMNAPISFLLAVQAESGPGRSLAESLSALKDSDWRMRVSAVRALEQWGTRAPLTALVQAVADKDSSVRAAAVHALGMLSEQAPIEWLLAALQDEDWHVRETAVLALGNLGERVPEKSLVLALKDSDSMVREAAHMVLQRRHNVVITAVEPQEERRPEVPHAGYSIVLEDSYPLEAHADKYGQLSYMDTLRQLERRKKGFLRQHWGVLTVFAVLLVVTVNVTGWLAFAMLQHAGPVSSIVAIQATPTFVPNLPQATATPLPPPISEVRGTPVANIPVGQTIDAFQDQSGYISGVAWSPDGTRIASASADGSLEAWNVVTGQRVFKWNQAYLSSILAVAWSPDGNYIALSGLDEHNVNVIADIYILDAHTTQIVSVGYAKSFASKALVGHIGALHVTSGGGRPIFSLAWSPDSQRVAAAVNGGPVQVFNVMTGANLGTAAKSLDINAAATIAVSWSPNGRYIAYGSGAQLILWDTTNGQIQTHVPGVRNALITSVEWSPDGQRLAVGVSEIASNAITADIWNPFTGVEFFYDNHIPGGWSPDGTSIVSVDIGDDVQVWDASNGNVLFAYADKTGQVSSVAWSPDGNFIASGDFGGVVNIWRAP